MDCKSFCVNYRFSLLVLSLLLAAANAQERWSWSGGGDTGGKKDATDRNQFNVRSDVLAFQGGQGAPERKRDTFAERQGRYEVKETTTKRPGFARPQNDEFSGEFGEGNQSNDFGINQKFGGGGFGGGPINGQFGPNPYGINPGFPGAGGLPFQGGNALGGGYYPGQQFGGGYGGFGGGHGGGLGGNGILVGPGGPTGIIGRPSYNRFPLGGGGYYPGGAGYPYGGGGGGGGFGNPGFSGQPGGYFPPGGYSPGGGGFFQQQQPFGGLGPTRPFGPLGGGPQFGPQFDQTRQANKKVEKRESI